MDDLFISSYFIFYLNYHNFTRDPFDGDDEKVNPQIIY